ASRGNAGESHDDAGAASACAHLHDAAPSDRAATRIRHAARRNRPREPRCGATGSRAACACYPSSAPAGCATAEPCTVAQVASSLASEGFGWIRQGKWEKVRPDTAFLVSALAFVEWHRGNAERFSGPGPSPDP